MRNTHIIAKLCLLSIAFFQAEIQAQRNTLNASVTIGRQGSDCRGRGICNFNLSAKTLGNSILSLNTDNSITLTINRERLTEVSRTNLVSNLNRSQADNLQTFEMEDAFMLSKHVAEQLNMSTPLLTIPKGHYPMTIDGNNFIITFKLK